MPESGGLGRQKATILKHREKKWFYFGGRGSHCLVKWGDSPNLEGWIAKGQVYFFTLILQRSGKLVNQRPFCLTFSPTQTGCQQQTHGVTRKGATASRLGREETSQEEAKAPLLAPSTGRRSCAIGPPARRAPPPPTSIRSRYYAALDPSNCPRSPTSLRFHVPPNPSQLSSRESSRPERGLFRTTGGHWRQQGWASPSQAHSTPPRPGPGGTRLRDREGERAPLPPPYLPY